jgi:hypothetical protein
MQDPMMDLAGLYTTLFGQPHLAGRLTFRRLALSLQPSALSISLFVFSLLLTQPNSFSRASGPLEAGVLRSALSILLLQHAARQLITCAYAFICH